MTRRDNDNKTAEAAEFNDAAEIEAGANYAYEGFDVYDKDPAMTYFFAAKDEGGYRPDGAARMLREGWKRSEKECFAPPDCVALEIPTEVLKKRKAAKQHRDNEALRDAMRPANGLGVLANRRHGQG